MQLFRKYNIKNCHVKIRPNFRMLCMQYLRDTATTVRGANIRAAPAEIAGPSGPSGNAGNVDNINGGNNLARGCRILGRRTSLGGMNLFNVDGIVHDYGSDFLPILPASRQIHSNQPIQSAQTMHVDEIGDIDADNSSMAQMDETDETLQIDENIRPYLRIDKLRGEDFAVCKARDNGDNNNETEASMNVNEPGANKEADVAVLNDTRMGRMDVGTVEPDEPNHQWSPGPSQFIDPFRRTAGGFALFGRRRSICVLSTIREVWEP